MFGSICTTMFCMDTLFCMWRHGSLVPVRESHHRPQGNLYSTLFSPTFSEVFLLLVCVVDSFGFPGAYFLFIMFKPVGFILSWRNEWPFFPSFFCCRYHIQFSWQSGTWRLWQWHGLQWDDCFTRCLVACVFCQYMMILHHYSTILYSHNAAITVEPFNMSHVTTFLVIVFFLRLRG